MTSTSKIFELQEIHNVQIYLFHDISIFIHLWNFIWIFNNTALIVATEKDHSDIVRELISQESIDVNIKDIWITKNSWCSKLNFYWITKLTHLWNFIWQFNNTALFLAAFKGNLEIVRELISQKSIDVNIRNIWFIIYS